MLPTFIILFREILEIAIILTIILAATRGVPSRGRWVLIGLLGGAIGAGILAFFAQNLSEAMNGAGQEIFNAGVLAVAVIMIGWTVVWMQSHGRQISQKMKKVGKAVSEGETPLYSVAVVVSLAMWREGAEIVLFMMGIISSAQEPISQIILGGVAGGATASLVGVLLYFGLITLSTRHLFSVTGWLLIFLASGMSAGVAGYLSAADIIPAYGQAWDSSWLLSQNSIIGKILHAMLGYSERPSLMQLLFYIVTFCSIFMLQKLTSRKKM
jgi:high-affinity iron transporter